MKGDRVQAIGCPPGLVWRGRRHRGGVAYLLRLYIDCINVMLGVVTWTESNISSIVFQTEVRGRGRVPRVPGKGLGVICSGSKAESASCSLSGWPGKGQASLSICAAV